MLALSTMATFQEQIEKIDSCMLKIYLGFIEKMSSHKTPPHNSQFSGKTQTKLLTANSQVTNSNPREDNKQD